MIKIIKSMISDHNGMKLGIMEGNLGKLKGGNQFTPSWITHESKKKSQRKLGSTLTWLETRTQHNKTYGMQLSQCFSEYL